MSELRRGRFSRASKGKRTRERRSDSVLAVEPPSPENYVKTRTAVARVSIAAAEKRLGARKSKKKNEEVVVILEEKKEEKEIMGDESGGLSANKAAGLEDEGNTVPFPEKKLGIAMKSNGNNSGAQTQEKPTKPNFRPAKDDTKPVLQDPILRSDPIETEEAVLRLPSFPSVAPKDSKTH